MVYDASARLRGPSLNDCLHMRPKFNQKILDLLLRFRKHQVALTADIEKAFLMIQIAKEDHDALRFLWVDDINKKRPELIELRFTRVIFGASPSPFLLNATIQHQLQQIKSEAVIVNKLRRSLMLMMLFLELKIKKKPIDSIVLQKKF